MRIVLDPRGFYKTEPVPEIVWGIDLAMKEAYTTWAYVRWIEDKIFELMAVPKELLGMKDRSRKCLHTGCKERCGKDDIFCTKHWYALPHHMREQIWEAHRQGDRNFSLELIKKACKWLTEKYKE